MVGIVVGISVPGVGFAQGGSAWVPKSAPAYVNRSASVVLNGKIYVFGSDDGSGAVASHSRVYDPVADQWSTLAMMPTAVGGASAAVVNGLIYVVGGYNPTNGAVYSPSRNQVYDPAAGSWSLKAAPAARCFGVAQAVGNKIYFIGGEAEPVAQALSLNEVYDPTADTWSARSSMPTVPRAGMSSAVIDGKIYVIGGSTSTGCTGLTEIYNPVQDSWGVGATMPTARSEFGVGVVNGKIYTVGGVADGRYVASNEEYNAATDSWAGREEVPVPMGGNTAAAVNELVYAIGLNRTVSGSSTNCAYTVPPCEITPRCYYQGEGPPDVPDYFGFGPSKTSNYGCLLCCLASMLTSIPPLARPITPAELDSALKANFAYTDGDQIAFPLVRGAFISLGLPNLYEMSYPYSDPTEFLNLHFCVRGERVIVQMLEWTNGVQEMADATRPAQHYVIVTGRDGVDWDVFDPGWKASLLDPDTTLGEHTNGFRTQRPGGAVIRRTFQVSGYRVFSLQGSDSFAVNAACPVELLVTAPNGLAVGFDPVVQTNVYGISNATYTVDGPIIDVEDGPALGDVYGVKTVSVPAPESGVYQVLAYAVGTGSYLLTEQVIRTNTIGQVWSYSNSISAGNSFSNAFTVEAPLTFVGIAVLAGGTVELRLLGTPGYSYSLQATPNLAEPALWTTLGSSTADTNGAVVFFDAGASVYLSRYYRAVRP